MKNDMDNLYRPSGKQYLYVNDNGLLKIDNNYIQYVKSLAAKDNSGKCTMCLHNDIREHVHEMINVYPGYSYIRPHSHPFKTETKMIIEGKLLVIIYNDGGDIVDEFIMSPDGIFTFRVNKGVIHTNIPVTDVVFHEIISGPFIGKNDSVFPPWAPDTNDVENTEKYMMDIKGKIKKYLK